MTTIEKKYYIRISIDKYHILTKETLNNFFFFWSNYNSWGHFQAEFTQEDIDNFPPEIKGAIDCGFLEQVEVEE